MNATEWCLLNDSFKPTGLCIGPNGKLLDDKNKENSSVYQWNKTIYIWWSKPFKSSYNLS